MREGSYETSPDVPATWFVDPPYAGAGRHYRCAEIDYPRLGGWCRARQGQTIVCENVGATWLPFSPFMVAKATSGDHRSGTSAEAIWVSENDPAGPGGPENSARSRAVVGT